MRQSNTTIPPLPVYDPDELEIYGNACYDAGREDHISEIEQLPELTDKQIAALWPTVFEMPRNPRLLRFARAIEAAVTQRKKST